MEEISPAKSPTSPDTRVTAGGHSRKRNASIAGLDSSPGSNESPDHDGTDDGTPQPGGRRFPVKRACNECRQQKVSHLAWLELTLSLAETYRSSCAAMSCKNPSPSARDASDFALTAGSRTTSSEWARDRAMRRWRKKS